MLNFIGSKLQEMRLDFPKGKSVSGKWTFIQFCFFLPYELDPSPARKPNTFLHIMLGSHKALMHALVFLNVHLCVNFNTLRYKVVRRVDAITAQSMIEAGFCVLLITLWQYITFFELSILSFCCFKLHSILNNLSLWKESGEGLCHPWNDLGVSCISRPSAFCWHRLIAEPLEIYMIWVLSHPWPTLPLFW